MPLSQAATMWTYPPDAELARTEQAAVETRNNVISGNFARPSANDQLRKAA